MVYGEGEKIFCMTSTNNGRAFSKPVEVGQLTGMHLGHTRGPQIASSRNFSMITAIDKQGRIHSYSLNHAGKSWRKLASVNDVTGSAVEGLMALTADQANNFYAAWLDIRIGKKNNIYFSSLNAKSSRWSENILVYKSPDEHVCECCKPNIAYRNNRLVIGFRNWLLGSRDIYYAVSINKGKTFTNPEKSGKGTWQLNACPMDGGGLALDEKGIVYAAWRRNNDVYFSQGKQAEQRIGAGRDVSMTEDKGLRLVAWQDNNRIKVKNMTSMKTTDVGTGMSPKIYILPDRKAFCVWEENKNIRYRVI